MPNKKPLADILAQLQDTPLAPGIAESITAAIGEGRRQRSSTLVAQATRIARTDPGEALRLALLACDEDPKLSDAVSDSFKT